MSWVKLATNFYRHPKGLAAGPDGRNLFIAAMAWAGEFNTDGALPAHALPTWAMDAGVPWDNAGQVTDKLVEVRLWDRTPDGWQIHDWSDWQTTAEEREAKAKRERDRKAAWRAKRSEMSRSTSHGTTPGQDADATRQSLLTEAEAEAEAEIGTTTSSSSRVARPTPRPKPKDDDDSTKLNETLELVATHLAASNGKTNQRGYRRTVIAEAPNDGRQDAIVDLIATHPTRDPTWLADEHLGRPHPPDPHCPHCGQPRHPNGPCPTLLTEEDQ